MKSRPRQGVLHPVGTRAQPLNAGRRNETGFVPRQRGPPDTRRGHGSVNDFGKRCKGEAQLQHFCMYYEVRVTYYSYADTSRLCSCVSHQRAARPGPGPAPKAKKKQALPLPAWDPGATAGSGCSVRLDASTLTMRATGWVPQAPRSLKGEACGVLTLGVAFLSYSQTKATQESFFFFGILRTRATRFNVLDLDGRTHGEDRARHTWAGEYSGHGTIIDY